MPRPQVPACIGFTIAILSKNLHSTTCFPLEHHLSTTLCGYEYYLLFKLHQMLTLVFLLHTNNSKPFSKTSPTHGASAKFLNRSEGICASQSSQQGRHSFSRRTIQPTQSSFTYCSCQTSYHHSRPD